MIKIENQEQDVIVWESKVSKTEEERRHYIEWWNSFLKKKFHFECALTVNRWSHFCVHMFVCVCVHVCVWRLWRVSVLKLWESQNWTLMYCCLKLIKTTSEINISEIAWLMHWCTREKTSEQRVNSMNDEWMKDDLCLHKGGVAD